jgi:hypothetical protein
VTAKDITARNMLPIYLRDTLEKLATKHELDEPELQRIRSLQSQLAANDVDDKVLQTVMVSICDNFDLSLTEDRDSDKAKLDAMVERLRTANGIQTPRS